MFVLTIGQAFHVSIQRDFLLRVGRRELHWERGAGFTYQRVPEGLTLSTN
jgi:hypothetical protein